MRCPEPSPAVSRAAEIPAAIARATRAMRLGHSPSCPRSAAHRAHSQGLGGGGRAACCRRTRISRRSARSAGGQRPAVSLGPPAAQEKEEARLSSPTPRRLWKFVSQHLHLASYFRSPGDGRRSHKISAKDLLWSFVLGTILRQWAFLAIEALVGSRARRNLNVSRSFGDDALGYFTARLEPA